MQNNDEGYLDEQDMAREEEMDLKDEEGKHISAHEHNKKKEKEAETARASSRVDELS